jgi:hypothetical protein
VSAPTTLASPPDGSFLREARAIDPGEVVPLHADAELAEKNVAAGVAAVLAYDAHVAEHLPHVDLGELRSLPDLARAVVLAGREAGTEDDEARALLDEAYALRRKLRAAAVALTEAGVLAPRDLAKLGGERGGVDVSADCAALASLFQRRAEDVAGKAPLEEGEVTRAAEIAAALKARWKPAGAARKPGPDGLSAVEKRDRLWTLLVLRHERLWAVGAYVYGHAVDQHVPALHAPIPSPRRGKAKGA